MSEHPEDGRSLKPDDLKNMRVKDGALYWNGKKIKAETTLSRWQRVWAVGVTIASIVGAVSTFAVELNKEFCWLPIIRSCMADATATPLTPNKEQTPPTIKNE